MNGEIADVIGVGVELSDTFKRVIVVYTNKQVVCSYDYPVLSGNKFSCPNWHVAYFDALYHCLCTDGRGMNDKEGAKINKYLSLIVPNRNDSRIKRGQHPWL